MAEAYLGGSVPVQNLFLELKRRYVARATVIVVTKEPGNKTWGGSMIRPRRSANLRELVKHGGQPQSPSGDGRYG